MTRETPAVAMAATTRADAVGGEIRRMILSGELPAGTRLLQNQIAERFGVSTTPVREAFTALAREGLVRQDAHRGAIVFAPSVDDMRENYEIRATLESLAAEQAAVKITAAELRELTNLLKVMRKKIREDPAHHTRVLNPKFHLLVNSAARRPHLLQLIETFRSTSISYHALLDSSELSDDYIDSVQAEHDEIVAALTARDPLRAAEAVKCHIENNFAQLISRMPSPPGPLGL